MNKKALPIMIIFILLAVVISLMSVTFLWFLYQPEADTNLTEISSLPMNLSFNITPEGVNNFMGQTGTDAELDAPYRKEFDVSFICYGQSPDDRYMKIAITELFIKLWNYIPPSEGIEEANYENLTAEQIVGDFTLRLTYENRSYMPDSSGFFYCLDSSNVVRYLMLENGVRIDGALTLVYLKEQNYKKWLAEDYNYDEFTYSAPDYMDATFCFNVQFQLGEPVMEFADKLNIRSNDESYVPSVGNTLETIVIHNENKNIISNFGDITKNETVKAYLAGVIISLNGVYTYLTEAEIADNFTLRISYNDIIYNPSGGSLTSEYFYTEFGESTAWLALSGGDVCEFDINIICQDESDYSNFINSQTFTPTAFAYGTPEYSGAVFYYDIRIEMVDTPVEESAYTVTSSITFGIANDYDIADPAFNGENGMTLETVYAYVKALNLTSTSTKTIKATINGVTIVHTSGVTEILTISQIENNFTLRISDGSTIYAPYSGAIGSRADYFAYKLSISQYDWLELTANTAASLSMSIIYQNEADYLNLLDSENASTAFAFTTIDVSTGKNYKTASYYFDVKIEMVTTP